MRGVKIVAFSDTHGVASLDCLSAYAVHEKADIVAIAGDVQTAYLNDDVDNFYRVRFCEFVNSLMKNGIDIVITPGNHDSHLVGVMGEVRKERGFGNLHILVDEEVSVKGIRFYGTPWCPTINGRWSYEMSEVSLSDVFSKIPDGIDVLLSHTPPLGMSGKERWDMPYGSHKHLGSDSLREAILSKKPRVVVFGHIHSGSHNAGTVGKSKIVNVSRLGDDYRVRYLPAVIMLSDDGRVGIRKNGVKRWCF